jgi:membrane-bound metal-dependent hydrolase YbcI (DUF457 family)
MNTQTHIIICAALFGRPMPKLAWAGVVGGLVPDLPMYAIIVGLRLSGHSLSEIFGQLYWEHWWQVANAIGHNFWMWGIVLASGLFAARRGLQVGRVAAALGGSALLHSAIDFLCHRNDGHMHFWPVSEWRFRSPVSYWDPAHFGIPFSLFEAALGALLVALLWRRYSNRLVRGALGLAFLAYAAVPAFFILGGA